VLKNVSLNVPAGGKLVGGVRPNNVYLYYDLVQASILADMHSFKLIFNVQDGCITYAYCK
jgi:hypothetical protein